MLRRFYILSICLGGVAFFLLGTGQAFSQQSPKRELRAAWIATVANIDWPSRPGLSSEEQKWEYIRLLDQLKKVGMNAVVVQIRPAADAFFPSEREPWSYWLTGKQGKAPDPYYDPLEFMIEEAHKRGMEFHAWGNPYRAVFDIKKESQLAPGSPVRQHPSWFVTYGTKKYFNPGLPEVRTFLVDVIRDLVSRYDVDAIHFDDYFYPYRIAGKEFPDGAAYKQYGEGLSRDDWRRENVNEVIRMLSKAIKVEKPWVKFGISPFGVWRNSDKDEDGSETKAGQTNYDDLYADVLLWLKKGWIDYVTPQIYWDFKQPVVPYATLLDWWAKHAYGKQVFIGQALYRIGNRGSWSNPAEMPNQIAANRTYPEVSGSMYFSAKQFYKNPLGINDSLINHYYKYPAIPPTMPWIDSIPPKAPRLLEVTRVPNINILRWQDQAAEGETKNFVIYRFVSGEDEINLNDPSKIVAIVHKQGQPGGENIQTYEDRLLNSNKTYVYKVTALDRLHNESGLFDETKVQEEGPIATPKEERTPKALYPGTANANGQ